MCRSAQMSEFHSASKLLQDIQIQYTYALDLRILQPVQLRMSGGIFHDIKVHLACDIA